MTLEPTPRHGFGEFQPRSLKELFDFLKTVTAEELVRDRRGLTKLHKGLGEFYYRKQDLVPIHPHSPEGQKVAREEYIKQHEVNPYPVLEFTDKVPGFTLHSLEHETFELADPNFYYYFQGGWPAEPLPSYLRPEDIVPSGIHTQRFTPEIRKQAMTDLGIDEEELNERIYNWDKSTLHYGRVEIPFNKTLNRVRKMGGNGERFNYNTNSWEDNGDGTYTPEKPSPLEKLKKALAARRTPKPQGLNQPKPPPKLPQG